MFIALALVAALQQPQAAFADLPHVTVQTYVVTGRTLRQVRESIAAGRPVLSDGRPRDAATNWTYAVRWRSDGSGACLPETTEVTYAITVTLPEFGEWARLERTHMARWNAWSDYLTAHERRRVEGLISGFEGMQAAMRAAPDCAAMTARRDEAVQAINQHSQALDQAVAEQQARDPRQLPTSP